MKTDATKAKCVIKLSKLDRTKDARHPDPDYKPQHHPENLVQQQPAGIANCLLQAMPAFKTITQNTWQVF